MRDFCKMIPVIFLAFAPARAQPWPAFAQQSDPRPQTGTKGPSDGKKPLPEETSPSPLPDSTRLEPTKSQRAFYPDEAKEKRLQGQVVVRAFISETGAVERTEVVSGDPVLAAAAVEAVKKWKFKPFIKNGKPVKVATKLPF